MRLAADDECDVCYPLLGAAGEDVIRVRAHRAKAADCTGRVSPREHRTAAGRGVVARGVTDRLAQKAKCSDSERAPPGVGGWACVQRNRRPSAFCCLRTRRCDGSACSPALLARCRSPRFGVAEVESARKLLKRRLPPPGVLVDAGSSVANEYITQVRYPSDTACHSRVRTHTSCSRLRRTNT